MKSFLLCILLILIYSTSALSQKQKIEKQPNIVFILADDLGWADLPMYGNYFNEAPNLKKLAEQGVLYKNAYAANPVCSPTRASILTGSYPARIGINDFLPGHWRPYEELIVPKNKTQYLPLSYETIAERLKNIGYTTGYFGKWHLGYTLKHYPDKQGFDESVVFRGGGYFNFELFPDKKFPEGKVLSEALTDLSINFIEKNKKKPFFLFLAHYDVHVQLDANPALVQKYLKKPNKGDYPGNAVYAAMIEQLDNSVGRIMKKLKALNLNENTLVIFTSDNGGLISRFDKRPLLARDKMSIYKEDSLRYIASSNKPLRGEKGTVYEGGIRVPLIIKWPGKTFAGTKSQALVSSIDFFPTILDAADGKLPHDQIIDGKSILPEVIREDLNSERILFWHYPVYHHSVPASAVRKGNWKLIHFLDDDHLELYNLEMDIEESNNLRLKNPDKAKELMTILNRWRREINAAMPEKNPNFDKQKRHEWKRHPEFEEMLNGE